MRVLDLFENAGDANLGQTLLRLAQLASDLHDEDESADQAHQLRAEAFWFDQTMTTTRTNSNLSETKWINGLDPQSALASFRDAQDDAAYTEVSR